VSDPLPPAAAVPRTKGTLNILRRREGVGHIHLQAASTPRL